MTTLVVGAGPARPTAALDLSLRGVRLRTA